jgi:hypothetical protein
VPSALEYDPVTRIIQVVRSPTSGLVTIDVVRDVYSDAKEQWLADPALRRLRFPYTVIGGEPIAPGIDVGTYVFLDVDAGWRIRPFEADHEARYLGNLYPANPDLSMFVSTLGDFTVVTAMERSSLSQVIATGGPAPGDSVWSEAEKDHILDAVDFMHQIDAGRWRIVDNQMVFYSEDGVTPLRTFDLFDENGQPTMTQPFERVPTS